MTGHIQRLRRVAVAATCALATAWTSPAEAQGPAGGLTPGATASAVPAAAGVDPGGYWQLVVKVQYGDDKSDDLSACPTGKIFNNPVEQLLNADQKLQIGVKIDVPGAKTVELAPIDISVRTPPKYQVFAHTKCRSIIRGVVYTSPNYVTSRYLSGIFTVSPLFYQLTKPTDDFVNTFSEIAKEAATLSTVTAPFADKVGKLASRTLGGMGSDISQERSLPLTIDPALGSQGKDPAWTVPKASFGGAYDIKVSAKLRRVGSLFNTSYETPPNNLVQNNNYFPILAQPFYDEPLATAKTMEGLAQYVSQTSYQDVLTKPASADVDNACGDLDQKLMQEGLSLTDSALIVWALGHKRKTAMADNKAFDDLTCVQLNKTLLTGVGVTLVSGGPLPVARKDPNTDQMNTAVTNIPVGSSDGQTDLNVFFKGVDLARRNQAAARLFADKPKITDGNSSVFRSSSRTLDNNSSWPEELYDLQQPFLSNLGCYAFFDPAKTTLMGGPAMVAIGKTPGEGASPSKNKEVWIVLRFAQVAEGERARIAEVEVRPSLPTGGREYVISQHAERKCGEGANTWSPVLLN